MTDKNIDIVTFGCRLNIAESKRIYQNSIGKLNDDVVIFNTCAVTEEAVRRAKQAIRRAKRQNPQKNIIITGCAAEVSDYNFQEMPEVSKVVRNANKLNIQEYAGYKKNISEPRVIIDSNKQLIKNNYKNYTRDFIPIQNGCDHKCTFCIIPHTRGSSRSIAVKQIVNEIIKSVSHGYKEVVLTGVDLTSYGNDFDNKISLGSLVKIILKEVPDLPRLRLSSVDCIEIDDDLIDVIANEKRFMPYLHLSLQSGDNMILKRMRRRHLRDDSIKLCKKLRKIRPDIAYGADIIVGFPTENEQMFNNSLNLVEECGLSYLHVFPYSARSMTAAARMPLVNQEVIKKRASIMRIKGQELLTKHLIRQRGKIIKVLVEKNNLGRAEDSSLVAIDNNKYLQGTIVEALVVGHDNSKLLINKYD